MEYGLCCLFHKENIKFKTYTIKNIKKISEESKDKAKEKVLYIWDNNIISLQKSYDYCYNNNIKSYRINSDIFPKLDMIMELNIITEKELEERKKMLSELNSYDLVLSMHPGQHVNMGSPTQSVIDNSLVDLNYHFMLCDLLDCEEVNIHVGGTYGDKEEAKKRFIKNMKENLSEKNLKRITLENDELNYSVLDVYEVCKALNVRLTYDIHHQRCYNLSEKEEIKTEKEYFEIAKKTWKGYGYQRLHISTPTEGYTTPSKSRPHHNYINSKDIPLFLLEEDNVHIDIEAKHKETAIFKLRKELEK